MPEPSENPYAAPPPPQKPVVEQAAYAAPPFQGVPSTVQQVLVVSIFQIIVGGFELGMAAILAVYTSVFGAFSMGMIEVPEGENDPRLVFGVISAITLLFGLMIFVAAVLRIWSGIAGFYFKRRKMAMAATILGMSSALTLYCSVFSIGILIYGLIIYCDQNVKRAYEMAEQGMTPEQIKNPANWL